MKRFLVPPLFIIIPVIFLVSHSNKKDDVLLNHSKLAKQYFNEDAQWYIDNIPFFECSDKEIEEVYYYRWKMYKAHIRNVGDNSFVITEFINHVSWDRDPYCTINAASMHHIYEGRWLNDSRIMDGYINNLFQYGGNNRKYSESVADAAYARYLVNADGQFLLQQLDSMKSIYNQWNDHWDAAKNLYYIPAMPDATEYNIAAIDASGGKDGFEGGDAFRPTINSYMYANAMAIAQIAAMKADAATEKEYLQKAASLKENINNNLWNDKLQHYTDRYKQDNEYVHYWDFIRGRELAGMAPWYYNVPPDNAVYNAAWTHVLDPNNLLGPYGLRTNEPAYEYYFHQFLYHEGKRGSQWNGPSWPYQTSQTITGMVNFLNNYKQTVATNTDFLKLLRLFTKQHYLPDGKINLVENYDPNLGEPIVYYYWSNHYNHSSYNNIIITGLCGIQPSGSDTLDINPLIDTSIKYFCLDDVQYHGHDLTVIYDKDGSKYNKGKGFSVWVDGQKKRLIEKDNKYKVVIGAASVKHSARQPADLALNIYKSGYPIPSASVNNITDTLHQAVDGRIWYFPEISNRWTTLGSTAGSDWYAVDFEKPNKISTVKIYPVADNNQFALPDAVSIEYKKGAQWLPVKLKTAHTPKLVGNTTNTIAFEKVNTPGIRIHFKHTKKQVAISEVECY
ncbi:MAG: discoidin domain-containing protein [Bacteroidota bacterium]